MVSIADQIASVKREIGMRSRVYPKWVAAGKMKPEQAAHEMECMRAVLETLTKAEMMPGFNGF